MAFFFPHNFFINDSDINDSDINDSDINDSDLKDSDIVMESGAQSRVRVGFGCHSLGFGSGSGVTPSGLGRVRVLFVGFRVFSGSKI